MIDLLRYLLTKSSDEQSGLKDCSILNAINEHGVGQLKEYDLKKLVSTVKEGLELEDETGEGELGPFGSDKNDDGHYWGSED
ncbi:hypothetical protein Ccrd_004377, partial [Cynara cardunculus var. scolymus]